MDFKELYNPPTEVEVSWFRDLYWFVKFGNIADARTA